MARRVLLSLWILGISYLEWRGWWATHKAHMATLMAASQGVLEGTPHWRAYQNRLLGPALLEILGLFSREPFRVFAAIMFLTGNLALYRMCARWLPATWRGAWQAGLVLLVPFVVWMYGSHFWTYPWDFLEMHALLVLAYLALTVPVGTVWPFVALYAVALFSRESALFIPMFVLIRAWLVSVPNRWRQTVLALGLIALGMGLIQLTRQSLFEHSSLPEVGLDTAHAVWGNHLTLQINQADWVSMRQTGLHQGAFALFGGLTAFYALACGWLWTRQEKTATALALTMLAYMLVMVPLAHLKEGRIYQPLGACTALIACYLTLHRKRGV